METNQFKSLINQLREIFPQLDDPNNLKSLDDCKRWFKDYKHAIKEVNQEYEYCLETLKALNRLEKGATKNMNYNTEMVEIVNGLYINFVKEKI